jgi:hypothetical protein
VSPSEFLSPCPGSRARFQPIDHYRCPTPTMIRVYLRHGPKARYGWVANPYRSPLLNLFPTGTFTLQDTPSFPRRETTQMSGAGD